jgi:hypothetical protein
MPLIDLRVEYSANAELSTTSWRAFALQAKGFIDSDAGFKADAQDVLRVCHVVDGRGTGAGVRRLSGWHPRFSTLIERSQLQAFAGSNPRKEYSLACEIFASVDFESSVNAQFLALISILEIVAKPAPRLKHCIDIVEDAMTRMKQEAEATQDPALKQALRDMHKGASHSKAESIRNSIRRLGAEVSRILGDPDPLAAGKAAVRLYDKRSKVVHEGQAASLKDVAETRQIAREALAS